MMHIIFSKTIKGCADISGGPFNIGSEKNKIWTPPELTLKIIEDIENLHLGGFIDDPVNLKGSPFATLIETKDDLAPTAWKEAEVESYKILGAKTYSRKLNLFHTWPSGNSSEPKG